MIAIIEYNAGNIRSVENAVKRLGFDAVVTGDPALISAAEKVILPGVGEAGSAMQYLQSAQLDQLILSLRQPVLGICLGLQLMCRSSSEGNTSCLGIFDSEVASFPPDELVPHMGWNNLKDMKGPLFAGIGPQDDVYFVHGYYATLSADTAATCDYILPFSAAMQKNNFYATQFHSEKSAEVGERILLNFLQL